LGAAKGVPSIHVESICHAGAVSVPLFVEVIDAQRGVQLEKIIPLEGSRRFIAPKRRCRVDWLVEMNGCASARIESRDAIRSGHVKVNFLSLINWELFHFWLDFRLAAIVGDESRIIQKLIPGLFLWNEFVIRASDECTNGVTIFNILEPDSYLSGVSANLFVSAGGRMNMTRGLCSVLKCDMV
jgi:hypothetical protein